MAPFSVVLVTGCSRGLGLGFVRHLLHGSDTTQRVIATCRTPAKAAELNALGKEYPKQLSILPLDVSDEASIQALPAQLAEADVTYLTELINNAGISSPSHPNDPILDKSSGADLRSCFDTNVVGMVALTQTLLPLLRATAPATAPQRRAIVNVSSMLGSIANCMGPTAAQGRQGGVAPYRISRAAANMATRCFAGELAESRPAESLAELVVVALSPGWVATDMGTAGGRTAPLTVDESVTGMLKVIDGLRASDDGRFLHYDGSELPW